MCSGGDETAKASEKQSLQFQQQLMNVFKQQYGAQSNVLNLLTKALQPNLENPQGYGDRALNAMRTNATDTIASEYDNAQKALQNQQFVNGGENLPSGVNAMQAGALKMGQASDTSRAQNEISVQDENMKQNNYWNTVNALHGVASQFNPNGTASNANGAAGSVANLSNAVTNSKMADMSPINSIVGAAGGIGGALFGAGGKFGGKK